MFVVTAVVFMMRTSFNLALVCMVNTTDTFNESDECPAADINNTSTPIRVKKSLQLSGSSLYLYNLDQKSTITNNNEWHFKIVDKTLLEAF